MVGGTGLLIRSLRSVGGSNPLTCIIATIALNLSVKDAKMVKLEEFKEEVSKLKSLLDESETGFMSWHMLFKERLERVVKAGEEILENY